jgi:hypothetical protein
MPSGRKIEKLLMNVIGQKLVEIELGGGLFFGGENRQET